MAVRMLLSWRDRQHAGNWLGRVPINGLREWAGKLKLIRSLLYPLLHVWPDRFDNVERCEHNMPTVINPVNMPHPSMEICDMNALNQTKIFGAFWQVYAITVLDSWVN